MPMASRRASTAASTRLTKNDATLDWFFKVSPLRNVGRTAPYYHDGSIATLEEAVANMAKVQLNRDLTDAQAKSIATFLRALTGQAAD